MTQKNPHTFTVHLEALPGKEDALKQALTALVAPTRQEPGCLFYDLYNLAEAPGKFMFFESWADKAAHELHCQTPHLQAWREVKGDLLAKPAEVCIWQDVL